MTHDAIHGAVESPALPGRKIHPHGTNLDRKKWVCLAGPYTLPVDAPLLERAVSDLERVGVNFVILSETKFNNVVMLFRERPPRPRQPGA